MSGDEWLAAYVREYGAERAACELDRLTEALRQKSLPTGDVCDDDFGLVPWTDDDAIQFKPGELDMVLVTFTDDDFAAMFRPIDDDGTK
jgi:hypothetical protein